MTYFIISLSLQVIALKYRKVLSADDSPAATELVSGGPNDEDVYYVLVDAQLVPDSSDRRRGNQSPKDIRTANS